MPDTAHPMRFGYRIVNVFTQGAQAGRPSTLQLRIDGDRRVFVAGEVVELGRGYVEL